MPAYAWVTRVEIEHCGGRVTSSITVTDDAMDRGVVRDFKFTDLPAGHQLALKKFVEGSK